MKTIEERLSRLERRTNSLPWTMLILVVGALIALPGLLGTPSLAAPSGGASHGGGYGHAGGGSQGSGQAEAWEPTPWANSASGRSGKRSFGRRP